MKRKSLNQFDSLDLLLDTICDTFGGVLFVAVLIAVLASRIGESIESVASKTVQKDMTPSLHQSLSDRRSELQSLKNALLEQTKTLADLQAVEQRDNASQVIELRHDLSNLASRRAQLVEELAQINQVVGSIAQQQHHSAASLELARKEELSLNQQFENERNNQKRTVNLPLLRQTSKREFPLVIRFGRLYLPFIAERNLGNRKSNLTDFVILDESGPVIRATPKPFAGVPISGDDQSFDAIRQKLNSLDNKSVYLAIGVWEDSFEQFQRLKEIIVKLGFEYRLVPVATGEFIQESPAAESLVQ